MTGNAAGRPGGFAEWLREHVDREKSRRPAGPGEIDCAVCRAIGKEARSEDRRRQEDADFVSPTLARLETVFAYEDLDNSVRSARRCPECGRWYLHRYKPGGPALSFSPSDPGGFNPAEETARPATEEEVIRDALARHGAKPFTQVQWLTGCRPDGEICRYPFARSAECASREGERFPLA